MKDVRENFVSLWARIVNREITQVNFWFLKKETSAWMDMDVIGIRPGEDSISLYNVKSNLNTDSKKSKTFSPEKIAENFVGGEESDLIQTDKYIYCVYPKSFEKTHSYNN